MANPARFPLNGNHAQAAYALAGDQKKSSFALEHAIEHTDWNVPKIHRRGLRWLAEGNPAPMAPALAVAVEIVADAAGRRRECGRGRRQWLRERKILQTPLVASLLKRMFCLPGRWAQFSLEAGAGAGKTYSLDKALRRLIDRQGIDLLRRGQQVGCITYTNVAKDEIISRIQAHPACVPRQSTAFVGPFFKTQSTLRVLVPALEGWAERLEPVGGIAARRVHYELGYPSVSDHQVTLRHDDVLTLRYRR